MSDPKADLELLRRGHPELQQLVRASRFIILRNRAKKMLRPRGTIAWSMLGAVVFVAMIAWAILSIPDHSGSPCGPGSNWATVKVDSSARIGGAVVTVLSRTRSGVQKSVIVRTPANTGEYHVIGVTPDVGMPTGLYTPITNGIVTLSPDVVLAGGGYNPGASIVSVDICRQFKAGTR